LLEPTWTKVRSLAIVITVITASFPKFQWAVVALRATTAAAAASASPCTSIPTRTRSGASPGCGCPEGVEPVVTLRPVEDPRAAADYPG
jgi:hypothetical protein